VLNGLRPSVAGHPLVHILWGEVHRRRGDHNLAADTYARAFASDVGGVGPFQHGTSRRDVAAWTGYGEECRRWETYETRAERAAEAPS
jgi:hypothetical protein